MKLLVVGAMGRAGRLITNYALEAGHEVVAFSRSVNQLQDPPSGLTKFQGDVLYSSMLQHAMTGVDAVISVLGNRNFHGPITLLSEGMKNIILGMKAQGIKRIITIGGAGILQESSERLKMESTFFPANLINISQDHLRVLRMLEISELDWTIVAPPFMVDGNREDIYLLEKDYFPKDALNEVPLQNVGDFIVREIQQNAYLHSRVGIATPKTSTAVTSP
ncbi:MAG: NAD(P)H-binding protein [Bacteroidota bacterium]